MACPPDGEIIDVSLIRIASARLSPLSVSWVVDCARSASLLRFSRLPSYDRKNRILPAAVMRKVAFGLQISGLSSALNVIDRVLL